MKNSHFTLLIFAVLTTILVLGIYGYMYMMTDKYLVSIAKDKSVIESTTNTRNREMKFLETYKETEGKWKSLGNFFVKDDKVVDFIESIENLEREGGSKVTIGAIDADNAEKVKPGKTASIRVRVNVQGSWQSVMKTLVLAENLPYKLKISEVQANAGEISIDSSKTRDSSSPKTQWNISFGIEAALLNASSTKVMAK